MDARGKFGKYEISFLSVLQTLQMHPQLDRYTHSYRGVLPARTVRTCVPKKVEGKK